MPSPVRYCASRCGFTLIELLVVITIIVVLLALLTPALDRAIYSAELAVCGANLRSIASASSTYAFANRRHYPKRNNYYWDALMFRQPGHPFDLRAKFDDYIGLDTFIDPLLPPTTLDDGTNRPGTVLYSNYSIYTGWGIPGFAALDRVGDRFTWQDAAGDNVLYRFDILAADEDYRWRGNYTTASHPDADGLMAASVSQDSNGFNLPVAPGVGVYDATIAWWVVAGASVRGDIEGNFAHGDGSVSRYDRIGMDDERMAETVVTGIDEYNQGRRAQLPPSNRGGSVQ